MLACMDDHAHLFLGPPTDLGQTAQQWQLRHKHGSAVLNAYLVLFGASSSHVLLHFFPLLFVCFSVFTLHICNSSFSSSPSPLLFLSFSFFLHLVFRFFFLSLPRPKPPFSPGVFRGFLDVCLVNFDLLPKTIACDLACLAVMGFTGQVTVRDLWAHSTSGPTNNISFHVGGNGASVTLKLTAA